jgi:cell division protein FtsI (penicillin-binding protein 3)
MTTNSSLGKNSRLYLMGAMLLFWCVAICGRLVYLQIFRYGSFVKQAEHQQQREIPLSAKRGVIYDRAGRELAMSVLVDSAFAVPTEVKDLPTAVSLITRITGEDHNVVLTDCRNHRTFCWVARKADDETIERIKSLRLQGIHFQKEPKRFYPARDLAAQVVGTVGMQDSGLSGIEHAFDDKLRGRAGKMFISVDARRQWFSDVEKQPEPGENLVLTIDKNIQYIAEKELARSIAETHALAGTVLVQDTNSGELLAVANWPTFDPNDPGKYPDDARGDRAVSAAYEPGSTFKVLTLTGAIENGVATPDDLIDCQMGTITIAGRLIHDWKKFGVLSVRGILANSSDVGAIKVALRLGAPRFNDAVRAFGIGRLTGIDLPGENRGLLRPIEEWQASSIGSLAMGQEVSVTPIQIISAISAVGNGGTLNRPHVVREIDGGTPGALPSDPGPQTATDAKTAAAVRGMMEDVMLEGTGKHSQLDGFTAGGKSGTAQKIDPKTGRYSSTQYNSSFLGFAPVNNPAITILVVLDSPVGPHHGGEVGGPVFKRVADQVLAYLGVPHDVAAPSDVETAKNMGAAPRAESRLSDSADSARQRFAEVVAGTKQPAGAPTVAFGDPSAIAVPNLAGQSVRGVTEACSRLGLVPSLIGDGIAVEQSPEAGAQVLRGSRVTVRFGRLGDIVPVSARGNGS